MNVFLFKSSLILATLLIVALALATAAKADTTTTTGTSHVLQQALATHDGMKIYDSKSGQGLNLSGGLFCGRASGIDPSGINYASSAGYDHSDRTAELEGDPRVHALLIDGSYDFDNHLGTGLPLHPYVTSGFGVAVYDHSSLPSASLTSSQGGNTVPLFRVGAGLSYKLGSNWNMSLDYKAGFSGGSQNYTGVNQQATDMQSVNMGMHFSF